MSALLEREREYMKDYERSNISAARKLRKNMTPWERKLWHLFLKTYPIRFQRQKAIGNYIVDFYCASANLAVELDGGGHFTEAQAAKDAERTRELEELGVRVLRIVNTDVDRRFGSVCEYIDVNARACKAEQDKLHRL